MMGHRHIIILFFAMFVFLAVASAQEADTIRVENYTRQQIKKMTHEELLDLSLEELMMLVKKLKLSSIDELYRMVLNPVVKSASKKKNNLLPLPFLLPLSRAKSCNTPER
ncbi:MAG: hypothetical protein U5L09_15380 [Bacteroidales bacterium]|nr:hypothetical protein [Bacteroidales bacterium]